MIIRAAVCITASLAMVACSDATAVILATKYIVTTSKSSPAAGDTVYVQAQLADNNGRSIAGAGSLVLWYTSDQTAHFVYDQSKTDGSGVAATTYIAGTKAGVTAVVSAIDDRHLRGESPPMTVVPGLPAAYLVTSNGLNPPVASTISLSAQLVDKYQNPAPIAGRVVTWSLQDNSGGGYYNVGLPATNVGLRATRLSPPGRRAQLGTTPGSFASPTSTTDAQGLATVSFSVGTVANASYVVIARDDQSATGSSAPIRTLPGLAAKFVVTVAVSDPPAGAGVTLTAVAYDAYDNSVAMPGHIVQWSVTGAGGSLNPQSTTMDQSGVATTVLTTGTTPGTVYTVAAGDAAGASGTSPTITTLEQVSLGSMASAFGPQSSCGIATDSKVWCWGAYVGAVNPRPLPGKPIGDMAMSSLSIGSGHACGISGGTVLCWGANGAGQLGTNSRTSSTTATPINSSLSFTSVSIGAAHSCALTTGGEIYCWGAYDAGRLGDGGTFTGLGPVKIASNLSFTAVSAGGAHTCAIATSGDAYCWGANDHAQIGDGTMTTAAAPVLVSGGLKFTAIAAGDYHTCGIASGTVYCWGDDTFGETGDGSPIPSTKAAPTPIRSTSSFVAVAAGGFHTCAIASDASAYCWGDNTNGELGNPSLVQTASSVPIAVAGGLFFKSIAAGGAGSFASNDYYYGNTAASAIGHSCGVTTAGVTYCWGSNSQGELGTSPDTNNSAAPKKVSGQH